MTLLVIFAAPAAGLFFFFSRARTLGQVPWQARLMAAQHVAETLCVLTRVKLAGRSDGAGRCARRLPDYSLDGD